jgi:hypothetical protein
MPSRNWFKKAVMDKPPYTTGWHKNMSQEQRLRASLASRPKSWTLQRKRLSSARALIALSNVSTDSATRMKARADARLLFKENRMVR